MYYQYEVTFSPYVMTPAEKWILNTIVVSFLSVLFLVVVTYLPMLLAPLARAAIRVFSAYGKNNSIPYRKINNTEMWSEMSSMRVHER